MEFIQTVLADLFDKFKAANPKMAAIIILVLLSIVFWSENGLGEIIGYDISKVVQWISIVLGFLTGSRTTRFISHQNK
jgi:hypothetical protein